MLRTTGLLSGTVLSAVVFTANAGIYAGVGVGPDTIDFKQVSHISQPGVHGFDVLNKTYLSGTGAFGTIFAGYEMLHSNFYLAAELNGNASTSTFFSFNHEYQNINFSDTRYKLKRGYGVSLLPGYQFSLNTLFYGRLGYTNATFKSITTDSSLANLNNHRDGFRYGVGVKQKLNERVSMRMDYSRVNYSHTKMSTFDAISSTSKSTLIWPRQQLLEFGLVVSFA